MTKYILFQIDFKFSTKITVTKKIKYIYKHYKFLQKKIQKIKIKNGKKNYSNFNKFKM